MMQRKQNFYIVNRKQSKSKDYTQTNKRHRKSQIKKETEMQIKNNKATKNM